MNIPVPKIIDHYSLKRKPERKDFTRSFNSLRVIRPEFNKSCDVKIALTDDYDEKSFTDSYEFDVPHLLSHLKVNGLPKDGFSRPGDSRIIPYDFFASGKGMLKRIMVWPHYSHETNSIIIAQPFDGTIFFKQTDYNQDEWNNSKSMRGTYAGQFFEDVATKPYVQSDHSETPGMGECRDHYYCVFTNKFGPHSIIYGGEVDALKSEESDPHTPNNYIELKIKNKSLLSRRNQERLDRTQKELWAQCVLSGIKEAVVGYRDDKFVCQRLVKHRIDYMPKEYHFNPWTLFRRLETFLTLIKDTVRSGREDEIFLFSRHKDGRFLQFTRSIAPNCDDYQKNCILNDELKDCLRSLRRAQ